MSNRNMMSAVVLTVMLGSYGLAGETEETRAESRQATKERQRSLELGKSLLKERPPADFVEWSFDQIPKDVKVNINTFLSVLQEHAAPHKKTRPLQIKEDLDVAIRIFAAEDKAENDLVEYRWSCVGLPLRVVQSLNALRVEFDLSALPECRQATRGPQCVTAARDWVEGVIKLQGGTEDDETNPSWSLDVPWPTELVDGAWFSSAPEQNIVRLSGPNRLHKRVDAFVEDGMLSLLFYKKIPQLIGYADGSKWFPDEFRELVHQKARE
jgi:hypothetical protein